VLVRLTETRWAGTNQSDRAEVQSSQSCTDHLCTVRQEFDTSSVLGNDTAWCSYHQTCQEDKALSTITTNHILCLETQTACITVNMCLLNLLLPAINYW